MGLKVNQVGKKDFNELEIGGYRDKHFPDGCNFCQGWVNLVSSLTVYKKDYGNIWACESCGAYVGTHHGEIIPYGLLADAPTRKARSEAHALFDPLWKYYRDMKGWKIRRARETSYTWLAEQMGITRPECHIAMMDIKQCSQVKKIMTALYEKSKTLKDWKDGKVKVLHLKRSR